MDTKTIKEEEEIEIDLAELFVTFLQHWKSILLVTALAAAIAFTIGRFVIVPKYGDYEKFSVNSLPPKIATMIFLTPGRFACDSKVPETKTAVKKFFLTAV